MGWLAETAFLERMTEAAYKRGFMDCVRYLSPASDELRATDARAWLRDAGLDVRVFLRLVRAGAITPFRKGSAANSAVWYRRSEILSAMSRWSMANRGDNSFRMMEARDAVATQMEAMRHD